MAIVHANHNGEKALFAAKIEHHKASGMYDKVDPILLSVLYRRSAEMDKALADEKAKEMKEHGHNCWCGMDHGKMDMDSEGNWVELP